MASGLGISEALAGQAVTATAMVALVSALLAAVVTRGLDRRIVLMGFSVLLIVSNLLVAAAPSFILLLLGRVLLGIALGRVLEHGDGRRYTARADAHGAPRALHPVQRRLDRDDRRGAARQLSRRALRLAQRLSVRNADRVVTLLSQMAFLPRLVTRHTSRLETLVEVLRRPGVRLGMLCCVLVFGGHFALFTYVRPFFETVAGVGTRGIALMLLGFGVANFAGTLLAGVLLERSLRLTLTLAPLVIGAAGLGLAVLHVGLPVHALLVALWGMAFGAVPVGWSTWMARAVPDETESAGGILVAAVQIAIAGGAALGGSVFAFSGVVGVFLAGGVVLLLTACVVFGRVARSLPQ